MHSRYLFLLNSSFVTFYCSRQIHVIPVHCYCKTLTISYSPIVILVFNGGQSTGYGYGYGLCTSSKKKKNHQKPRKVGSYLQEYLEPAKTVKKKKSKQDTDCDWFEQRKDNRVWLTTTFLLGYPTIENKCGDICIPVWGGFMRNGFYVYCRWARMARFSKATGYE